MQVKSTGKSAKHKTIFNIVANVYVCLLHLYVCSLCVANLGCGIFRIRNMPYRTPHPSIAHHAMSTRVMPHIFRAMTSNCWWNLRTQK